MAGGTYPLYSSSPRQANRYPEPMVNPNEAEEKDREENRWEDQKSFVGFYCDPSFKKRLEAKASREGHSLSETARRLLLKSFMLS